MGNLIETYLDLELVYMAPKEMIERTLSELTSLEVSIDLRGVSFSKQYIYYPFTMDAFHGHILKLLEN